MIYTNLSIDKNRNYMHQREVMAMVNSKNIGVKVSMPSKQLEGEGFPSSGYEWRELSN